MAKREPHHHEQPEALGQRLARLRKQKGLSQVQLAAKLKVSQANVSAYERGALRLHADIIVVLTKILNVSSDELLGLAANKSANGVSDVRLVRRLALIDKLPKRDKDALVRTISAFLERGGRLRAA